MLPPELCVLISASCAVTDASAAFSSSVPIAVTTERRASLTPWSVTTATPPLTGIGAFGVTERDDWLVLDPETMAEG